MSNIYIQEPSTNGKVLLNTSAGDIEIELWSKEAPLACRNFVQLIMEGYYKNTIFHRVIPGFIAQGGDPKGTGEGGESIYGSPFKDEFHSRLRFVRRGLVAMANSGPNDNGSQFFFTLGVCKELQNKHTIFGKVVGDTIYNLPRFEEAEIGKDDRPLYPHKITKMSVLVNPFDDIVPRVSIENEISKGERRKSKKKGVKNFSLLSFGGEAEEDEEEVISATKAMGGSGGCEPSLLDASESDLQREAAKERIKERLKSLTGTSSSKSSEVHKNETKKHKESSKLDDNSKNNSQLDNEEIENDSIENIEKNKSKRSLDDAGASDDKKEKRKKHRGAEGSAGNEVKRSEVHVQQEAQVQPSVTDKDKSRDDVKSEIRKLKQELYGKKASSTDAPKETPVENKADAPGAVQEYIIQKQKYISLKSKMPKKGDERDALTLSLFKKFTNRVRNALSSENEDKEDDWISHKVTFDEEPVLAKDANTKDDSWYELDDPRNPLNKRRREQAAKNKYRK